MGQDNVFAHGNSPGNAQDQPCAAPSRTLSLKWRMDTLIRAGGNERPQHSNKAGLSYTITKHNFTGTQDCCTTGI